jgi:hypothetical protein
MRKAGLAHFLRNSLTDDSGGMRSQMTLIETRIGNDNKAHGTPQSQVQKINETRITTGLSVKQRPPSCSSGLILAITLAATRNEVDQNYNNGNHRQDLDFLLNPRHPNVSRVPENPEDRQKPQGNRNDYDDIDDLLDLSVHRDVGVDKPEQNPDHDEADDQC